MQPAEASARPNLLILMVDQLAGTLFPDGPAACVHAPVLRRLAAEGVRFANAYCASPLCTPARAAFMTGQLPSRTGVYDNAAELPASIPTFAHYLRRLGYRTVLSGKMHFVGPDQLHGFEERLTTDIYPADFGWTPDWTRPGERADWWYHNLGSVTGAGRAATTNQLEFDDEVAYHAKLALYRLAREPEAGPFCLTVSFTHPHDPYVARRRYLDLHDEASTPMPRVASIPYEAQDPHSRRLLDACDWRRYDVDEDAVRRARRAYLANVSYLDERIGEILETLAACALDRGTVIVFLSDHGDMLGERGLWFKMSPFEDSVRIPLILHAPDRFAPRAVTAPVSALDVLPTLLDLAGGAEPFADLVDGASLVPLAGGGPAPPRDVPAEYAAEGAIAPLVMIRDARYKYVRCSADPPMLFDLERDPLELDDLARAPEHAGLVRDFERRVARRWDLDAFDAAVRASQARRRLVYEALRTGRYHAWDHEPPANAGERFMRNHLDLDALEARARVPRES